MPCVPEPAGSLFSDWTIEKVEHCVTPETTMAYHQCLLLNFDNGKGGGSKELEGKANRRGRGLWEICGSTRTKGKDSYSLAKFSKIDRIESTG
ncbi:hypothetical protein NPIL_465211 [Nephila pilipes]|uniref:Uncharacterized protein n=1 Tax=Nephila pilipes TaxID=299642 RepID=A0A8X6N2S4_NEPPI|nr:hypothetical protein NPIL_465211 [Nephila pilipes]